MPALTDSNPAPPPPDDLILWNVIEEHLDEAAFLYTQWERALASPSYRLEEVRDRVEERLLAHIDGLVVGGKLVAEKLLKPALMEGSEGTAFAAAMALLAGADDDAEGAVVAALCAAPSSQAAEVKRALELCPSAHRQVRLAQLLEDKDASVRAAATRILGFQRVDLGPALLGLLEPNLEITLQAGLTYLGHWPRRDCELAVLQALRSTCDETVKAALLPAAVSGAREVLEVCRALVRNRHSATPAAAVLLNLLGDAADSTLLRELASDSEYGNAAIFALGLGGTRETVSACLDWLRMPALAAAASETFLAITGADPEKHALRSRSEEGPAASEASDLDDDLDLPEEPAVEPLDAEAATGWWSATSTQFAPAERYFLGQPIDRKSPTAWLAAMERANMRQRQYLALALAITSAGKMQVQTLALCRDQQSPLRMPDKTSAARNLIVMRHS